MTYIVDEPLEYFVDVRNLQQLNTSFYKVQYQKILESGVDGMMTVNNKKFRGSRLLSSQSGWLTAQTSMKFVAR